VPTPGCAGRYPLRILWIKSGGLLPLDTGGKIRSYQLAKELARKHEVTLFTFYPELSDDPHSELARIFSRVICLPLKLAKRASLLDCWHYGRNLFSGRPHAMTKYCRPEVARQLREHLQEVEYDVLICDFLLTAAIIPWETPSPKIIFTHNVEAVIWRRHYQVSRNPVWKAIAWREYRTMEKMERHFLSKADHVLTVSKKDCEAFAEYVDRRKITVIETGVDVEYFRPDFSATNSESMIFTGSMDWLPNEDAIFYFAKEILPRVRKNFPKALLTVVGRNPSPRLQALAMREPGLKVTGRVEDIRPYMRDSAVYVVPLRIGGGTRIKIFEAMAMGKPVVSTTIGAEGLPVKHGETILLADTAEEFANSLELLFRDAALRGRIARSARELVELSHSWTSVALRFDSVVRELGRPEATVTPNPQEWRGAVR
jgi:polysaccharide biosynthesis protein PslH